MVKPVAVAFLIASVGCVMPKEKNSASKIPNGMLIAIVEKSAGNYFAPAPNAIWFERRVYYSEHTKKFYYVELTAFPGNGSADKYSYFYFSPDENKLVPIQGDQASTLGLKLSIGEEFLVPIKQWRSSRDSS